MCARGLEHCSTASFLFHVIECLYVCPRCMAAHVRIPVFAASRTFPDAGWELKSAHTGAHLAERPVTGERMKKLNLMKAHTA